ncbi:hypothetical protein IT400_00760 [Candidatus Nomurabacteria bacterium]|nr:hypothetical protein [Candidatus Nomurabacteria bacterium]
MKKFQKIILIAFPLLIFSHIAFASVLSINIDKNKIEKGGISLVSVQLDTKLNSINTIEGDLKYDKNYLKIEKINIGNSFISFWVEKPSVINEGIIHFSGIVPGGVTITQGDVFSVIFRGLNEGQANITLENMNLFLNDGIGTKDEVKINNTNLIITKNTIQNEEQIISNDKTKPEKFTIERSRSRYIYDNKWFIVFSTQDKGGGVDHYDVCEFIKNNCVKGDSPYLLKYQTPFYRVVVRAYDMDGNIRDMTIVSNWLILIIVLLVGGIIYFILYIYRRYLYKYRV